VRCLLVRQRRASQGLELPEFLEAFVARTRARQLGRELGNFGALSIVIGMLCPRAKPRCAAPVNCMQTGWLLAGLIARFALAFRP